MPTNTGVWPACRVAGPLSVIGSVTIDVLAVLTPGSLGLFAPWSPLVRLLLIVAVPVVLLALGASHCLHGRGLGGWLLGLRTVDDEAGLPPGSPRALIAVLRGRRGAGCTVYAVRAGADPCRGTLDELEAAGGATSPERRRRAHRSERTRTSRSRRMSTPVPRSTQAPPPIQSSTTRADEPALGGAPLPAPTGAPAHRNSAPDASPSRFQPPSRTAAVLTSPRPGGSSPVPPPAPAGSPPNGRLSSGSPASSPPAPAEHPLMRRALHRQTSAAPSGPTGNASTRAEPPPNAADRPTNHEARASRASVTTVSPPAPVGPPPLRGEGGPRRTLTLRISSPESWSARLSAAAVLGRAPAAQPKLHVNDVIALPDPEGACASNHLILGPSTSGAVVTDLGSGIATTVMPPGRSAVLCTPYTPVRVQTPFTLVLGNLTIAVSQE